MKLKSHRREARNLYLRWSTTEPKGREGGNERNINRKGHAVDEKYELAPRWTDGGGAKNWRVEEVQNIHLEIQPRLV